MPETVTCLHRVLCPLACIPLVMPLSHASWPNRCRSRPTPTYNPTSSEALDREQGRARLIASNPKTPARNLSPNKLPSDTQTISAPRFQANSRFLTECYPFPALFLSASRRKKKRTVGMHGYAATSSRRALPPGRGNFVSLINIINIIDVSLRPPAIRTVASSSACAATG